MKKWFLLMLAVVLMLSSGCSFKVERDVFYLPQEEIKSVEIQREYFIDEEAGTTYFRHKLITGQEDMEAVCEMIRKLPVRRASSKEPHPITEFSMIIILGGEKEHHLVLTEEMAFYDQVAYEYTDPETYDRFVALYNDLGYAEADTEPNRF